MMETKEKSGVTFRVETVSPRLGMGSIAGGADRATMEPGGANSPHKYVAAGLSEAFETVQEVTAHAREFIDKSGSPPRGPVDKGASSADDGNMDARIAKLEDFVVDARDRLMKIETRLDQTATKADLVGEAGAIRNDVQKGFNDTIKWVVGTAIVLGVAAITVITFVLNNAAPKSPAAQQSPIIITVPQASAPLPATK